LLLDQNHHYLQVYSRPTCYLILFKAQVYKTKTLESENSICKERVSLSLKFLIQYSLKSLDLIDVELGLNRRVVLNIAFNFICKVSHLLVERVRKIYKIQHFPFCPNFSFHLSETRGYPQKDAFLLSSNLLRKFVNFRLGFSKVFSLSSLKFLFRGIFSPS
jgi:hypothetical protein